MGNFYKRYIYKNGVKHGPYYYSNKKVDGKVISTYLGTDEPTRFNFKVNPNNKKIVIAFLSLVSVALAIYVVMNLGLFGTGKSIVDSGATGIIGSVPGEEINEPNLSVGDIAVDKIKEIEEVPEVITEQKQAIINSEVEWSKEIKLKKEGPAKVQIPIQATDIVVYSVDEQGNKEEVSDTNIGVTAQASSEIVLDEKEPAIISFFKKIFNFFKGTGNVVTISETEEFKEVIINENKNKYEIQYKTPGPIVTEEETNNGKKVTVSSPPGLQYNDVTVYTNIESLGISDAGSIIIYSVNQEEYVEYTNIDDTNEDGILDYLEWVSPDANNQTFEIIVITKAEHLGQNREFISDIYNEVKELDNIWSEEIPDMHYVRVTFEKNLTQENDITIFVKIGRGNPKIEVYEENSDIKLAEFSSLVDNEYNTIYLTNLQNEQDTFDLKIVGGSVFFDHVVDPVAQPGGTPDLRAQVCWGEDNAAQGSFAVACDGIYPGACASAGDRLSCNDNVLETHTSSTTSNWGGIRIQSYNSAVTDCQSITQVRLCYEWWTSNLRVTQCDISIDANGGASYTAVTTICPGTSANSGVTCVDVTSLESWNCENFFGSSGTRTLAKSEFRKSSGGGTREMTWDVLYFDVTYTVPNQPPVIDSVGPVPSVGPLEGTTRPAIFNIQVSDPDGFADVTSVNAEFSLIGEPTRSGACLFDSNIDADTAIYICTVNMQYYDKNGVWSVLVTATDTQSQQDTDNTQTFTYQLLKAIVINQPTGALNWPTLNPGTISIPSNNDPNTIENTGNYEGPIFITAYNLIGNTNPAENIPASNFRAGITLDLECTATQLQDGISVSITGSNLPRGVGATEDIYYCLTSVPYVSSQSYSANGANSWRIEI
ncbi:hypothetical protein HYT23_00940 [Candidatus Pacearchaeota archaeon]|nr:hypothetical protein [Candidatus Pacearchaeota archaeon]